MSITKMVIDVYNIVSDYNNVRIIGLNVKQYDNVTLLSFKLRMENDNVIYDYDVNDIVDAIQSYKHIIRVHHYTIAQDIMIDDICYDEYHFAIRMEA